MHRKYVLFMAAWVCGALTAGTSLAAPTHDFTGRCEQCHLSDPAGGTLVFTSDIATLCRECHERFGTNSHPSQGTPSMAFPPEFLWDTKGDLDKKLSCATCHAPHADAGGTNLYALRGSATGTDFCRRCHSDEVTAAGRHLAASFLAHPQTGTATQTSGTLALASSTEELDPISAGCVNCHDGSGGPHAGFCLLLQKREGCGGHIIGASYADLAADNPELHSVSQVMEKLSLYEGKIGCATCHNIYSHVGPMLAVDNSGSALCRICHNK